ncbi:hypothetical protein OAN96_00445 [Candidatus Gracilibacteria bacterium]|nr:hypothetical protein [Candidatus Gracilibacteria bacterium]
MKNNLIKDFYVPEDIFAVARNEAEVSNLMNNDVYKFYMLDFILNHPEYANLQVEWKMTIRSNDVKTAQVIPKQKLVEQLQATQNITGVPDKNLNYLKLMKNSSGEPRFSQATIDFLKTFKLPDFHVTENETGNYEMSFQGSWQESMMWEIFGLKIINTLYLYNYIQKAELSDEEFNEIIQATLSRLIQDIETFKTEPDTKFSEFGTRRSMSTDFQTIVNQILENELPGQYLGTSNPLIAQSLGHDKAIGTNAHELRMIPTALYDDPQDIIDEMYNIDLKWQKHFPDLAILLPDTYGTTFYQKNAPVGIIENHTGNRFDSKDPMIAIPEYIDWLVTNGQDPMTKAAIPSDGLNATKAVNITRAFKDKIGALSYGIGTNLSNNTKGTWPRETEPFGPFGSFSVVIKPSKIQRSDGTWVSTVKLSDNPEKAVGSKQRVQKFKNIFGSEGVQRENVFV